jgi:hypothetical protein
MVLRDNDVTSEVRRHVQASASHPVTQDHPLRAILLYRHEGLDRWKHIPTHGLGTKICNDRARLRAPSNHPPSQFPLCTIRWCAAVVVKDKRNCFGARQTSIGTQLYQSRPRPSHTLPTPTPQPNAMKFTAALLSAVLLIAAAESASVRHGASSWYVVCWKIHGAARQDWRCGCCGWCRFFRLQV